MFCYNLQIKHKKEETDTEEGASDLEIETELFTDTEEITESTDEILSETGSEINTFSSRAGGMTTRENGYSLIKQFESCRLTAYKAVSTEKYYTIGWGHYGSDVYAGMTITQAQADQYLKQDVAKTENSVNSFLNSNRITIGQNQFDALVSFTYNLGNVWVSTETFQLKTILKNGYTKYSDAQIRTAFTNWNKSGGQVLAGLTRRRNAEADLFLSNRKPDPITTTPSIWKNSDSYTVGDMVKFTWNSVDHATGYWFVVWYKGEQIVTTQVSGSSEYTLYNLTYCATSNKLYENL